MATKKRFIEDIHFTDVAKDMVLTITIGNDQIGGSRVRWKGGNTFIGFGKVVGLHLGKGADVIGKTLLITTNFFDQNPNTNNVSGQYNFNNGSDPLHLYFDQVQAQNDKFIFEIEITFKPEQA